MMNKDNILDAKEGVSALSNFQLVGIIIEQKRYSKRLIDLIQNEIQRREISDERIEKFKERYIRIEKIDTYHIKVPSITAGIIVVIFVFTYLLKGILVFVGISIMIASLYVIKSKFEHGDLQEKKAWRIVKLTYVILILVTVLVSFVLF